MASQFEEDLSSILLPTEVTFLHFPAVPSLLLPITPFLHEADTLVETVLSGQLDEEKHHEAKMVAYYCVSHALWLGQNVRTPDDDCVEFLRSLASWRDRLQLPAPRGVSASLDENRVCEFMGSVALLCHQQRDDSSYGSPHGSSGSLSMGGGGWLPPRNPASPGRVSPSSWSSSPQQSQSPLALACAVEQCCVSTGPATASMELFENERHAPFVGWSASHLLPYERGPISNEAGSVTLDEALRDVQPPVAQDFVWDGGWELEKEHTPCDEWGWSYGLSWWILALRLRHGNSTKDPSMALVRRRKWIRHMCARGGGGNLPAAIEGAPRLPSISTMEAETYVAAGTSTSSYVAAAAALSVCATAVVCADSRELKDQRAPPTSTGAQKRAGEHSEYDRVPTPPPPELPDEARDVLTMHALHAIKLAEEMMQHSDPLHMRRWFHAAVVYFEVIRAFGDLSPELDAQRQRVRRLARLCSHLRENCVLEHDSTSRCVTDVYELPSDRVLGRGSYGTVSLAIHRSTREEYACKVLDVNRVGPQYVDKLHAEISSMRQLDHPNILRLREVFFGRRKIYLIMDLCNGGELFELVNTSIEHRTEACATRFMAEMFSAVQYLHNNGVVHRDLKLENWLFENEPGSHLKLIDFGLARHFRGHERIHGAVGSMYYVAPEVLRGSYDARCDLWSLGVIAYMLVSGAPPFWGKDDRDIRRNILSGRWEFPPHFFAGVSLKAKDFIARLLTHDPDRRMTSQEALNHPWLAQDGTREISLLPRWQREELLGSLRGFTDTSALQKVVLAVVAFHLTPPRVAQMRDLFAYIDTDRSGTISFAELAHAVQTLSDVSEPTRSDRTDTHLRALFNAINISRSAEINFTEFLAATLWQRIQLDEEHVRHVFDTLDIDGTERLNATSVKSLVGMDFDDDEVAELIAQADADGDGELDYEDFLRAWRSSALQTHHHPQQQQMHMGLNGVATVVHSIAHWQLSPPCSRPSSPVPLPADSPVTPPRRVASPNAYYDADRGGSPAKFSACAPTR